MKFSDSDWDTIKADRPSAFGSASMSAIRVTLLFGSAAVAMALFLAPLADRYSRSQLVASGIDGIDLTSTGSTTASHRTGYVIRRSVLQPSPNSVCIIGSNGSRNGDC